MNHRISKRGDVEIEFFVVRTKEGHVSIWTQEPPPAPNVERHGPFIAEAKIPAKLAPA
jgi:hypothetical protein